MGAGKSTLARSAAERIGRPFVDVDDEIERRAGSTVAELFAGRGEAAFRSLEEAVVLDLLERRPAVLALGGGAVLSAATRAALKERALTVVVDVAVEDAWERARGAERPLAQDAQRFRELYEQRGPLYDEVADARARDVDAVLLAAAGVHVEAGALELLGALVPGSGRVALVTEPRVAGIHGAAAQVALGGRLASTHELPTGEAAKAVAAVDTLWRELELERGGSLVALGGGCVTDAAGFVAATYLRGVAWVPVPTTLVGQIDAAIGGKTGINLPAAKNLVGAFHWPARVVADPVALESLSSGERENGMAEAVKTGLLAGEPLWELPTPELVRRCAAYKAGVCLADPLDRGPRNALNLGHTFAHALEAAAAYETFGHGRAVALGLLAALRLSGADTSVVEEVLRPVPVRVDPERAWAALRRDKKAADGRIRLVLLPEPGKPVLGAELPETDVRRALEDLISS